MNYKDIGLLYSQKDKYLKELDSSTYEFQRLLLETLEWKIPNLALVIPPSFSAQKVAEVGCFNGHLIANIAINGHQNFLRYGYDVNKYAIDCGKKLYKNVNFSYQDIFEAEENFDLLILSDIIEHIEDDQSFLHDCSRFSKNILINLPLEK
jgi:2-polyprenyl-3-methyl-5-hydroxy-6-metoxy-1,4-benzoquinol methylase